MKYYPAFLSLSKKRCVVVGGGEVAARKTARLLDCGAFVTVVAEKLKKELLELKKEGRIGHIEGEYRPEHLEGAFLVIGATDKSEINEMISSDSRSKGILVNIVDDPERCDFILPSLLERGALMIAVSTSGKSPALARLVREELEEKYGEEYGPFLEIIGELRKRVMNKGMNSKNNRRIFEGLLDSEMLGLVRAGRWSDVERVLLDRTGERIDIDKHRHTSETV